MASDHPLPLSAGLVKIWYQQGAIYGRQPVTGRQRARGAAPSFGAQFKAAREQLRLSLREVAKIAMLSPGMVSKIEHGSCQPSIDAIQALLTALPGYVVIVTPTGRFVRPIKQPTKGEPQ